MKRHFRSGPGHHADSSYVTRDGGSRVVAFRYFHIGYRPPYIHPGCVVGGARCKQESLRWIETVMIRLFRMGLTAFNCRIVLCAGGSWYRLRGVHFND